MASVLDKLVSGLREPVTIDTAIAYLGYLGPALREQNEDGSYSIRVAVVAYLMQNAASDRDRVHIAMMLMDKWAELMLALDDA